MRVVATGDISDVLCRAISTIPINNRRPCCLHSSPQFVFHRTKRKRDHNPYCLVTFSCQLSLHLTFPLDTLLPVKPGFLVTEVISLSSAPPYWIDGNIPISIDGQTETCSRHRPSFVKCLCTVTYLGLLRSSYCNIKLLQFNFIFRPLIFFSTVAFQLVACNVDPARDHM